jgi:hypothetical protein
MIIIKSTQKLKASEKEIRQKLSLLQHDSTPVYKNLRWRFDLQVISFIIFIIPD